MVAILFDGVEPFEQIGKTPSDRRPLMKSGEIARGLREDDI